MSERIKKIIFRLKENSFAFIFSKENLTYHTGGKVKDEKKTEKRGKSDKVYNTVILFSIHLFSFQLNTNHCCCFQKIVSGMISMYVSVRRNSWHKFTHYSSEDSLSLSSFLEDKRRIPQRNNIDKNDSLQQWHLS